MIFDLACCHTEVYARLPLEQTKCSKSMFAARGVCTDNTPERLPVSYERALCARAKEREVFSSAIICRFLYSLFPLCLAHIRGSNSTPLAIPGVLISRPHSQGKALRAHGGELQTDILQITAYHTSPSQIHWRSIHLYCWMSTVGSICCWPSLSCSQSFSVSYLLIKINWCKLFSVTSSMRFWATITIHPPRVWLGVFWRKMLIHELWASNFADCRWIVLWTKMKCKALAQACTDPVYVGLWDSMGARNSKTWTLLMTREKLLDAKYLIMLFVELSKNKSLPLTTQDHSNEDFFPLEEQNWSSPQAKSKHQEVT